MELAPKTPVSAPKVAEKAPKLPLAREIFDNLRPGGEPLSDVYAWFATESFKGTRYHDRRTVRGWLREAGYWLWDRRFYPLRRFQVWRAIRVLERCGIAKRVPAFLGRGTWIEPDDRLYHLWAFPEQPKPKREVDFYVRNEVN